MRILILFFVTQFMGLYSFAQIPEIGKKDSCYFVYDKSGQRASSRRYAEWQCGKILGIVDCGDRLEYDEDADIVYLNNRDMVNSAGANKPFSGTCESCHMNGVLSRKITFVNGRENGLDTTYYESGCPQVVRSHINGKENGQWVYMYDSTQYLAWEMNYYMGEKHGKHIFMKKNGDTTKWENYKDGRLDGIKRTYYSDSRIKREVNYKLGILDGAFKIYNLDRVVIEEINYKAGKKHQEAMYYYDDGKPLKIEHWNMGVKNGEFKIFYYQGHVQEERTFKKGKQEGWYKLYYPDSKVKNESLFEKDILIEEHRYDEQGRETYSFGTPTGDQSEDDAMPTMKKKKKKKKKNN